jgi:hypothetical protein
MSAPDWKAQLQKAIALAQAGRREEARTLLQSITAADPSQELAWMWLATAATDTEERIAALEQVLTLNPDNSTAHAAYVRLTGRAYAVPGAKGSARPSDASSPLGPFLILMAVAAVLFAAFLIYMNLRKNESDGTVNPTSIFPAGLLSPTSIYSPTPSRTPRPTNTPGPSPTPVTMPPTWTPSFTSTLAPTQTLVPTWTPRPDTATPTPRLMTETFTPLPVTDTATPQPLTEMFKPPSETPTTTAVETPTATPTGS